MAHRVLFTAKGKVEFSEFDPGKPGSGEVSILARQSLISTGTEGICLHQMYEPGTHWDDWVKYPFASGYCLLGEIESVGPDVDPVRIGKRVVCRTPHASRAIVPSSIAIEVPTDISDEQALWFALATIGFMGAKAGRFRLGDSVLVVGAGPVGQMALRWSVAAGARIAAILDPVRARLDFALKGGATHTICGRVGEVDVSASLGLAPRVVVDATGHAPLFEQCLKLPSHSGTLVLLGDSGTPSQQRLTLDVVRRGIQIHGAHIMHETPEWTEATVPQFFFELAMRGRFDVDGLITHRFRASECAEAYRLTTAKREETMGVVLDWQTA